MVRRLPRHRKAERPKRTLASLTIPTMIHPWGDRVGSRSTEGSEDARVASRKGGQCKTRFPLARLPTQSYTLAEYNPRGISHPFAFLLMATPSNYRLARAVLCPTGTAKGSLVVFPTDGYQSRIKGWAWITDLTLKSGRHCPSQTAFAVVG